MLPSVAINRFVPGAGYGASAISYGGNAAQQAYENGATFDEAVTIGEIEGLKSAAIDKVLGKVGGKGKGAFDKIFNLGSGKKLVDTGKRIVSEGMGEVADTATDPLVDRAVYNPTAPWATPEELIKSFGGGATIGTFYQIPAAMKYAKNSPAPSSRGGNLPTAAGKAARSKPQLPTIADMVSPKINGRAKPQGMGDFRKMEAERERQTDTITSDENIARYRSEVNGVFTGELPAGSIVTVGETPGKLLDYGAKPSNITMTQDTARKLAYPQGYFGGEYGLGIPALKGLPAQIQNPMAILKSKTQDDSLVLLTEWQDQHNNPVIIPLRLNRRGSIELENRWPSAPGEKEFSALLGENRENLLYTRESKDLKTLLGVRH